MNTQGDMFLPDDKKINKSLFKDYQTKDAAWLLSILDGLKQKLFKLRFQASNTLDESASAKIVNIKLYGQIKKMIARIKTQLSVNKIQNTKN